MFATLLTAAALILPALSQGLVLNTPASLNQCSNTQVTWSGTNGPYWLIALNPSDPCGAPLTDYGMHDGQSMTIYNASYVKGQQIELSLIDSQDNEAWTGTITVGDGPTNCLSASQLAQYNSGGAPAANAESSPTSSSSSHKASSSATKNEPLSGAVSNGQNAATTATYSLPVIALSAAAGIFALL